MPIISYQLLKKKKLPHISGQTKCNQNWMKNSEGEKIRYWSALVDEFGWSKLDLAVVWIRQIPFTTALRLYICLSSSMGRNHQTFWIRQISFTTALYSFRPPLFSLTAATCTLYVLLPSSKIPSFSGLVTCSSLLRNHVDITLLSHSAFITRHYYIL